ncbi:MAG TPA: ROK family protein [Candidatus Sulfotelmatobacter sp.]|nr:ROK family protein [Candidatus Sulfotelmatobacter sp.]
MKPSTDKNSATPVNKRRVAKRPRGGATDNRQKRRRRGVNHGLVVGVDIGGSNLRVALADLHGNIVGRWNASTKATSSPERVVAQIEEGIDCLLRESSSPHRSLLSVAVGAPGATDVKSGVVLATSYLRGWKGVPLQEMLESALGIPAAIENDVRMAALGEHWRGAARGVDDFVFLAIGTGIGAGIFANGKLVHGAHGTAGEVGYMHVPHAPEEPARPGEPGSLERMIGGDGIAGQWRSASDSNATFDLTATEIFARAGNGDPRANGVLDRSAQLLAYTIYNISLVVNSALFILGGGVGVSTPLFDATERALERYSTPSRPRIVISGLGTDAQLMGAIQLALTIAKQPTASRA